VTSKNVAYAPLVLTITSSPTAQTSTPSPTATITPEASEPTRRGAVIGGVGRRPERSLPSIGFTPIASTSTTTSPADGSASGRVANSSTSGPPIREYCTTVVSAKAISLVLFRPRRGHAKHPSRPSIQHDGSAGGAQVTPDYERKSAL